jgi:hypothetical protein
MNEKSFFSEKKPTNIIIFYAENLNNNGTSEKFTG